MATLARLSVDLIANSAKFRKDLDKATKHSNRSFNQMQKKAKMAGAAFAAAGGAAALAFGKASIVAMGNFEEALADVRAKTDGTRKEIDDLSISMRNAAKVTKFTATQTAEAGTFLAQAGLNIMQINKALRPTLDLAAATKTSVQNTADFMTNIMKGLGMSEDELARAADVLSVTTAKSNTNLTDLATAMSYAAPSARAMGMSIEETAALIGMMANAGIKGSTAGTALRATFGQLANQGDLTEAALAGMTGGMTKQQTVLKRLGVHTTTAEGKIRGLTDILTDLKNAGGTETDMIAIFGRRAGSAMMQFMNEGLEGADELRTKLNDASGAAERMANVQLDSLNGDILLMKSQFEELQLIFADQGLNQFARSATQKLTMFFKSIEPQIKWVGENLPQIGIALAGLASPFVLAGLALVTKMLWGMATAAMANPYVLAGVAIAAFAVLVYNNIGRIKVFIHNVFAVSIPKTLVKLQMAFQKMKLKLIETINEFLTELAVKINLMIGLYNKIPWVDQKDPVKFLIDTSSTETKLANLKLKMDEIEGRRQTFVPEEEVEAEETKEVNPFEMPETVVEKIKGQFDDLKQFQQDYYKSTKDMATGSWSALIEEGSKGSKKLLMIKRAYALKNIIIAGAEALAEAAKLPFPANIAAGVKAAAGTAMQIQTVQGQFHDGIDNVPNTGTYLLEQGERVVDNRLNKDLSNFLASNNNQSTVNNSPTLNFNVNGGDEEGVRKVLQEKRGEFESMIRQMYNENAQNAPF